MANKLYQEQQQKNPMNAFPKFMQNPMQALTEVNLGVPQEYQNDPRQAVNYLVQSGKISQDKFNRVVQIVQRMGIRL